MTRDLDATRRDVLAELKKRRLEATPDALGPLRRVDFKKLVAIYDHEERFLFDVFVSSLVTARKTRLEAGRGTPKVTAHDVRTAMLMLGAAAASASPEKLSDQNKPAVKGSCPYCRR